MESEENFLLSDRSTDLKSAGLNQYLLQISHYLNNPGTSLNEEEYSDYMKIPKAIAILQRRMSNATLSINELKLL